MAKRGIFKQTFGSQHVNGSETLLKSARHLFYTTEMLGLSVNTLTAGDKYSRHNRENFPQQIQMHFSQKQNSFSEFSIAFLKSASNSDWFQRKDEPHSLSISEITDSDGDP